MLSSLQFSIEHPNGRREQLAVDAERALVGSGAHCEVRLGVEDADTEHLLVLARQGMVFAEARALEPPPAVNGAPFTRGRLLPDSRIRLGRVQLSIALVERASDARDVPRSARPTVRTYLLLLVGCALAYWIYTHRRTSDAALEMPDDVPALWSAAPESCPQQSSALADARADELRVLADAKRERSPFHPEDGVAAVSLYQRAAVCYALAGRALDANASGAAAEALASKLVQDFHLHRLRLERSLLTQDWSTAHRVIRSMLTFLRGRSGDYVNWLSNVDRRINIKFSSEQGPSSIP